MRFLLLAGAVSVLSAIVPTTATAADGWTFNAFRNPSIGLEYRRGALSTHAGYYTTILRDPGDAPGRASGFWRTGVTVWWQERAYASLSHLRGLDGQRRGEDFAIAEVGLQYEVWDGALFRLGVAAIPAAHGFKRKINPTPGLSLRLAL